MQVLNIFHVLIAIAMIAFILIQKGAGATAGAAFGSGASGTVFGSRGAGNFLSRTTWVLATAFCLISLTMAVMASRLSQTPETDLGVVAQAPVIEQTIEPRSSDLLTELNSADPSDLPQLNSVNAQPAVQDNSGDLPVIDAGTSADEAESEAEDEALATDDGN